MLTNNFRNDYPGEFVVTETRWVGGKKQQQREWVPNPIENYHISGRAACIGSHLDRHRFNYTILQRHRGGLLSSKKLQTYGVGSVASQMRLDFVCESNKDNLQNLKEYSNQNIVYTTATNCIQNPGMFYLIPQNPKFLDLATIIYLAAFDGHQEIFLHGYNKDTPVENPTWMSQITQIMTSYSGVNFFLVGEKTNMFKEWLEQPNAQPMTHREFISYCDV